MKFFVCIFLSIASPAFSQGRTAMSQQLINANYVEVPGSKFFVKESASKSRETVGIDLRGTRPVVFQNYSANIAAPKVLGLADGVYQNEGCLILFIQDDGVDENVTASCESYFGNGGYFFLKFSDLTEKETEDVLSMYQQVKNKPIQAQLVDAGFAKISENFFEKKITDQHSLVAVLKNAQLQFLFRTGSRELQKHITPDVEFIPTMQKSRYGNTLISFRTDAFEINLNYTFTEFDIDIVGYAKSLDQIPLTAFGKNRIPQPYVDPDGFSVGAMNSTEALMALKNINGRPVSQIESAARAVQPCSAGLTFLGPQESLVNILAIDNKTVMDAARTHQDIALPLYYIREIINAGTPYKFNWKNQSYEILSDSYSSCGGFISPFNDQINTAQAYPVIKNMNTGEILELTFIHPFLISMYGFYGGHLNTRPVSPAKLMHFFY